MTTRDPQFAFSPSFEACPAQQVRRSSLKANSEYEVSRPSSSIVRDHDAPAGGSNSRGTEGRKSRCSSSSNNNNNNNNKKKKKSRKSETKSPRSSTATTSTAATAQSSGSLTNKQQMTRDMMNGPMGQSGATNLTDITQKQDNSSARKEPRSSVARKEAAPPTVTRPGAQHVTGDEHRRSETKKRTKDSARTSQRRSSNASSERSRKSAEDKIREFNSKGKAAKRAPRTSTVRKSQPPHHEGPSPVSVSDSRLEEEHHNNNNNNNSNSGESGGLLGEHIVGDSRSSDEDVFIPPTNVKGNGYLSEKARLFEGYDHKNPNAPPAKPDNFIDQYTVVSRGSEEDAEDYGPNVTKSFNDSFNKDSEMMMDSKGAYNDKGGKVASKGAVAATGSKNPGSMSMGSHDSGDQQQQQTQVVASHGMAGAPGVEYGVMNGGLAGYGYGDEFDDEGLAIAIAVDDSYYDSQDYYHHAIEYNPDAKPPLHKNRRFRYYCIIVGVFACLAGGAITAVVLLLGANNDDGDTAPSMAPSDAPTTAAEGRYREQFISLVGPEVNVDDTPHDRAAVWIMYEDRLRLSPFDDNLIQRYLLAYFYFATTKNEETAWRSCNRPKFNEETSCNHQMFVRNPMDDSIYYEPVPATRWLSDTHECDWVGVLCDDGDIVIAIDIWGQELKGPLPVELSKMPFLNSIALAYNAFTGSIPTEYAQMRHLVNFEVHGNKLAGSVPREFFDALTLQNFNIAENQITGTLSSEIGLLTGLKGLHFSENHLTGSLPSELGNLVYLSYFRADANQLTGSIPTVLGQLGLLQELWIQENLLSGTIPSEIGNMADIIEIRMDRNRIYGTIPEELWNNKVELTKLDLQDLLLSGTLSTKIGDLNNLESLRLRRNRLTGTVPTELAKIRSLRLAWLHLNEFTGSIPLQICSRVGPGFLEYLNADCGPEGAAAQECECCHGCCDRNTELCQLTDFNP